MGTVGLARVCGYASRNEKRLSRKVQAPERSVLTTQLYFPHEPANRRDGLIRRELVMRVAEAADGLAAHVSEKQEWIHSSP